MNQVIKLKLCYLIFVFTFLLNISIYASVELNISKIHNYKVLKDFYVLNEKKFIIIRSFNLDNNLYFLLINLDNLESKIINNDEKLKLTKVSEQIFIDTNYYFLSKKSLENSNILSNAGINSSISKNSLKDIYLTIDMCPSSKKSFEKEFFSNILNLYEKYDKKVPISIAITHKWIKKHKEEFNWFLENSDKLDITWINHSKSHYYNYKEGDLSKNFMLHDINSFEKEILDVEKILILNNQIPSILFRFPGLISNNELIEKLVNVYSLIPLGTNNWLAKEEKSIETADIILVHGNLNEPKGIKIMNENIFKYKLGSILEALK